MSETLEEVDEIAKTIPEVAPPGWGHTVAKKEKTKPNKPKSKVGGSAHEFQKDLDSGKFKGLPGDKTKADKKASMFKLMWSMKNKGDKPHYKPGVKDKLKSQYKEEVEVDETLDLKKIRAQRRAKAAGRMKDVKKVFSKKTKPTTDRRVEPRHDASVRGSDRGYFEEVEMEAKVKHPDAGVPLSVRRARKKKSAKQMKKDMGHATHLSKTQSDFTGKPVSYEDTDYNKESNLPPHLSKFLDKEGNPNPEAAKRMAVGRKKREAPKIKDVTPKGYGPKEEVEMDEASPSTDHPWRTTPQKRIQRKSDLGKYGARVAAKRRHKGPIGGGKVSIPDRSKKEDVEMEGRFASAASDPRMGGSSSVDTVPDFTWKAKKGAISAPGSGSISKAKKAKASDVNKSIEQQMKDAMKENTDKWRENFKANAAKRLGQRRREQQAGEVGQKAKPRPKDLETEEHNCNEIHPDKTHSKWLNTQNEDWKSIKEAQWKVKLKGLPTFYVPGKSAGEIRQMLRRQLKRPMDDIEDVTRATPAAKKKDFRTRAQGQEDSAVVSGKG